MTIVICGLYYMQHLRSVRQPLMWERLILNHKCVELDGLRTLPTRGWTSVHADRSPKRIQDGSMGCHLQLALLSLFPVSLPKVTVLVLPQNGVWKTLEVEERWVNINHQSRKTYSTVCFRIVMCNPLVQL